MTSERARAYRHVLNLVDALAPAKLHAAEQAAIREAADSMLFSNDPTIDVEARGALDRLGDLMETLVEGERILPETAEDLLDAVEACGPRPVAA